MPHRLRLATADMDVNCPTPDRPDHAEPETPDVLRFDRRCIDRWPMESAATAFRLGGEKFGEMHELKVLDLSHGGLGAISNSPIEPGASLSIGFAAPGHSARRGTVVRCVPCGHGYRVAVAFESRLAA